MELVLTDSQFVDDVRVVAKDKKGAVVADPNTMAWSSTDASVVTVEDDPNHMEDDGVTPAKLVRAGMPGKATVQVTDGTTFIGTLDVTVVPGGVASLEVVVGGTPQEQ